MRVDAPVSAAPASAAAGALLPALFVLIWSTGFVVARYGMPHAPPLTFLALRYALSIAAFVVWIAIARAAWPLLKERCGALVAIGGTSGRKPEKSFTIGSSVNAAVAAFTKCLADLGKERLPGVALAVDRLLHLALARHRLRGHSRPLPRVTCCV